MGATRSLDYSSNGFVLSSQHGPAGARHGSYYSLLIPQASSKALGHAG